MCLMFSIHLEFWVDVISWTKITIRSFRLCNSIFDNKFFFMVLHCYRQPHFTTCHWSTFEETSSKFREKFRLESALKLTTRDPHSLTGHPSYNPHPVLSFTVVYKTVSSNQSQISRHTSKIKLLPFSSVHGCIEK